MTFSSGFVGGNQTVVLNNQHIHNHYHVHAADRGAAKSSDVVGPPPDSDDVRSDNG